jgi:ssDNA thymidine ADP-ribosyltransferase DarT-like protein
MASDPKTGKLIYHITAMSNLQNILTNGLMPRDHVENFTDVADNDIIKHRTKHELNQFVPFHFFGSSPFAGAIQSGYPDKEFIYITLSRATAKENNFKILLKHPLALDKCELFEYDKGMETIDWDQMKKRDYSDQECKNICMAECLCDRRIIHTAFHAIYCKDAAAKEKVEGIIKECIKGSPNFYINTNKHLFKK